MTDIATPVPLNDCIMQLHTVIKPLRGLLDVLEILERARDAEAFLDSSKATLADLSKREQIARQACADAEESATATIAAAKNAAEAMTAKATAEAARILAAAKDQAEGDLAAARGKCLEAQKEAQDAEERAKKSLGELDIAEKVLLGLTDDLAAAKATIAKAEAIKLAMA